MASDRAPRTAAELRAHPARRPTPVAPGRCRVRTLVALLPLLAACARSETSLPLTAVHDRGTRLGTITLAWEVTGAERAFADGARLPVPQVRVTWRLDARNTAAEKVFVRLSDVRLLTRTGATIAADTAQRECVLAPGTSPAVLRGEIWVPRDRVEAIARAEVSHLAAPLAGRGLRAYRAWLLQGRPSAGETVDREIAAQAAAPPCAG